MFWVQGNPNTSVCFVYWMGTVVLSGVARVAENTFPSLDKWLTLHPGGAVKHNAF